MVLVPSLNLKLLVRKWTILLQQRSGSQNQDFEIPEVPKDDSCLRTHFFGLSKGPFMKHFTRQHEQII